MNERSFNILCVCAVVFVTIVCVWAVITIANQEEKERIDPRGQVLRSSDKPDVAMMWTSPNNAAKVETSEYGCVQPVDPKDCELKGDLSSAAGPCIASDYCRKKNDVQWKLPTSQPDLIPGSLMFIDSNMNFQYLGSNFRFKEKYIYTKGPCVPDDENKGFFKCGPIEDDER